MRANPGSPPQLAYDERAVAPGTNGRGAAGFMPGDRELLRAWLGDAPRSTSLALAARAALRTAPCVGSAFRDPVEKPQDAERQREVDQRLTALAGAVAWSFWATRNVIDEPTVRALRAHADALATASKGYDGILLVSASAIRTATESDFAFNAVATITEAVDAAYSFVAIDPGAQYSYAPGAAVDELHEVSKDVAVIVGENGLDDLMKLPCHNVEKTAAVESWTTLTLHLPKGRRNAADVLWLGAAYIGDVDVVVVPTLFPIMAPKSAPPKKPGLFHFLSNWLKL